MAAVTRHSGFWKFEKRSGWLGNRGLMGISDDFLVTDYATLLCIQRRDRRKNG